MERSKKQNKEVNHRFEAIILNQDMTNLLFRNGVNIEVLKKYCELSEQLQAHIIALK